MSGAATLRWDADALLAFTVAVFERAGLSADRAHIVARAFLEADLLGFHTHGLIRVPQNIDWLKSGATRATGEPAVLQERGAVCNWDAGYLPGPYVMDRAIDTAAERARTYGCATLTIRKSQHVACLAPYVLKAADLGLAAWMVVATPAECLVTVHNGLRPLFSTNPFAFAFPTTGDPIFADMSLAITAGGKVKQAYLEGTPLPGKMIVDKDGALTDEPTALLDGALLPLGGVDHGHKGYGLLLWSELFTTALAGWGRLDEPADGDANSVFLHVVDPEAFGGLAQAERQAADLAARCRAVPTRPGCEAVRVPGDGALARKREQLAGGVALRPYITTPLETLATELDVAFPAARGSSEAL